MAACAMPLIRRATLVKSVAALLAVGAFVAVVDQASSSDAALRADRLVRRLRGSDSDPPAAPKHAAAEAHEGDRPAPPGQPQLPDAARPGQPAMPEAADQGGEALPDLTLINMTEKARTTGAVCLDGTPGAFYWRKAPNATKSDIYHIHLQGGGWCYDGPTCYNRSQYVGGTTTGQPLKSRNLGGGLLSTNCTVNPDFCDVNIAVLVYCDGTSFSGNREDPLEYVTPENETRKIWFRGLRILEAALDTLHEDHGLGDASQVLLSGSSAGGVSGFTHGDMIHERLLQRSNLKKKDRLKFKIAPMSGFMLDHKSTRNRDVWPRQMREVFHLSNWTLTNHACVDDQPKGDAWRCMFAPVAYQYLQAPIFVSNSIVDLWQVQNIYTAEPIWNFTHEAPTVSLWSRFNASKAPGWEKCADWGNLELCSKSQIFMLNKWMDDLTAVIEGAPTFSKDGNGVYLYGCYTHDGEVLDDTFTNLVTTGSTIQAALSRWWASSGAPATEHSYIESNRFEGPAPNAKSLNSGCKSWDMI